MPHLSTSCAIGSVVMQGGSAPAAPAAPTLGGISEADVVLGYSEVIALTASSTDGDLTRIDWVLDPGGSETIVATDAASPYAQNWTCTQSDGAHTLVARAVRGALSTDSAASNLTITRKLWERITGGAAAWRSDLGVTVATGVSSWASQVVGGGNLANATGTQQPAYSASDANWGGLPSITGDNANDNLVSDKPASFWNFLHDGSGATALAVVRPIQTAGNKVAFATHALTSARGFGLFHVPANDEFQVTLGNGTTLLTLNPTGGAAEGANYAVLVTHKTTDTPDADLRYPIGTSRATGSQTPSASDATGTLTVFAATSLAAQFGGGIVDLELYQIVFDATQRGLAELYVAGRYSL